MTQQRNEVNVRLLMLMLNVYFFIVFLFRISGSAIIQQCSGVGLPW